MLDSVSGNGGSLPTFTETINRTPSTSERARSDPTQTTSDPASPSLPSQPLCVGGILKVMRGSFLRVHSCPALHIRVPVVRLPPIGAFHDLAISLRSPFSVPYLLIVSGDSVSCLGVRRSKSFASGSLPLALESARRPKMFPHPLRTLSHPVRVALHPFAKSFPLPSLQHRRWGTRAYP